MLRRLIDRILGAAARAGEGLWDPEAHLVLLRGRPPDWTRLRTVSCSPQRCPALAFRALL